MSDINRSESDMEDEIRSGSEQRGLWLCPECGADLSVVDCPYEDCPLKDNEEQES